MSEPISRWSELPSLALRALTLFHRWVGVVMCVGFATWFATGAVMVFVAFPALPAADRARLAEPIELSRLRVAPDLAAAGEGLRLVSRLGEPAYVLETHGVRDNVISAETGARLAAIDASGAGRIASRFGRASVTRITGPFDYDQWVVHQQFDHLRPFYRVRLADGRGGDYYVSAATGEVVQRTFAGERAWNWLGSVIHWIYLTPIRQHFPLWDWLVWSIALVGLSTAMAGLWLGVTRARKKLSSNRPALSPFRGLLRWHHVLGLAAGVFVLSWITSGWLSMDHGRLFSLGEPSDAQGAAYRGPAAHGLAVRDLQRLAPVSSVVFTQVAGRPIASGVGPSGPRVLIGEGPTVVMDQQIPRALIASAVSSAWPGRQPPSITHAPVDGTYAKAESLPVQALLVRPSGPNAPRLYIDGISGRILVVMDRSREAYAWVYYALHTYNFPGLSSRPVLRTTLILIPLSLGFAFSITGLLVAIRRLRLTATL